MDDYLLVSSFHFFLIIRQNIKHIYFYADDMQLHLLVKFD